MDSTTSTDGNQGGKIVLSAAGSGAAGGLTGIVTTALTYPLDLIRTRFQVHDGVRTNIPQYNNTYRALKTIIREEGLLALYNGMNPAIIGASASWAMYLFGYTFLKTELEKSGKSATASILVAGVVAGAVTSVITNPIWVVKTRLQTDVRNLNSSKGNSASMINTCRNIWRAEGPLAFYKGLMPSIAASYHGAVQFLVYESFIEWTTSLRGGTKEAPPFVDSFVGGGISKVCALVATQPLSLIKSRLQEQKTGNLGETPVYKNTTDAIVQTFRKEGIRGFYKGVGPAMWRLMFHSAIFFSLLETVKDSFVKSRIMVTYT